jgi:subtilisin family serine protease
MSTSEATYYYVNGEKVPLVPEPKVFALKFREGRSSLSPAALDLLKNRAEPLAFVPNYGIKVYRSDRTEDAVRVLGREDSIDFATPAFRQTYKDARSAPEGTTKRQPDVMFLTRRFVAQFKSNVTRNEIDAFNAQNGVRIMGPLGYAENGFLLEALPSSMKTALELANLYFESGKTVWSHPDFVKRRHWRAAVAEERATMVERTTYLDQQWHLTTAKVVDAWSLTKGEPSIKIAILDDGVDVQHPEFDGKVVKQYDFQSHVDDGSPKTSDEKHGTSCAGVATAAGIGASGSAPGCSLIAVHTPDYLGVADEAAMFHQMAEADYDADVISCSWGPADGTGENDPLPDSTRCAINYCLANGRTRNGTPLGIPIFWAAGNGDESVMLDGYASNPDVIAVAASTSAEKKAWYSDHGAAVWVCAPSSGDASAGEKRIFTTDRRGGEGYNPGSADKGDAAGDYTNSFGGTSSATPLTAGVAALMLSVNPDLTAADVKDILAKTADQIGSGYDASGHSDEFGYGRINALKAVQEAQSRKGSPSTPAGQHPSVTAPASVARSDGPPSFDVDPGSNTYYAVEIAGSTDLFLDANAGDRTTSNYFASWDNGFLSSEPYTLDSGVWDNLKSCDRLYYRAWTSSSDSAWADTDVSTDDSDIANAPSMEITDETSDRNVGRDVADDSARPAIVGPDRWSPHAEPPTFSVVPGRNRWFAVEVATSADLLDRHDHGAERTAQTFFGSWSDGLLPADSSTTYTLPGAAWKQLLAGLARAAEEARLYYRVVTASAVDPSWPGYETSTDDGDAANAPYAVIAQPVVGMGDDEPTIPTPAGARAADEALWRDPDA